MNGYSADEPTRATTINAGFECLDRQVAAGRGDAAALYLPDQAGTRFSYAQLLARCQRFAAVLQAAGLRPGDTLAVLLNAGLDFHTAVLGGLRMGAVVCPLDPGFGEAPLLQRLSDAHARVLVTSSAIHAQRSHALLPRLPALERVLIVDADAANDASPQVRALPAAMALADERGEAADTRSNTPALMHFTSGTTGRAKAVIHGHGAILGQRASAAEALDLKAGDRFWCTAAPGWVTATCYGVLAPLSLGATTLIEPRGFDPALWMANLYDAGVNVWYTTPTALRMLRRLGVTARPQAPPGLRHIASVGEPLDVESIAWAERTLGQPVHDTWWQTETGAIMIANPPGRPVVPGAMGLPLAGIEAAVLDSDAHGARRPLTAADAVGELALRAGWPSMFTTYLGRPDRYRRCFHGNWYLTGDLVRRDAAGQFHFVGRKDDLIKTAGHLIGPFEIENLLLQHPAVAEAGVVGLPDPLIHEAVTAFVVPAPGRAADAALERDILAFARERLGALAAPRRLRFCTELPKTGSGKILRRQLREQGMARDLAANH